MAGPGFIKDRGIRGLVHTDKPLVLDGASRFEPLGSVVLFDDFLGDTLNTDLWVATETGTGTPWAISSTAGDPVAAHGGWIACATQNIDAAAEELGSMAATTVGNFRADRAGAGMLVFESRVSIPTALTARLFNVGLTDDETEGAPIAMTLATTTWTTTATDAAMWTFCSTATDNDNWIGQTVDTNTDGTHVASGIAAAADTAARLRIELDTAGLAYFYQDGVYQGAVVAGVTPTVPLIPYVAAASSTTTAVPFEVDYIYTACAR